MNDQLIIAAFINLDQSFNNLIQMKLKGKKIIEQLSNTFYERQILIKQLNLYLASTDQTLYNNAISNSNYVIGSLITRFQDDFLKKYSVNVQVLMKNRSFIASKREERSKILQSNYQILIVQLLQLGFLLIDQYEAQLKLIQKHWIINTQSIFTKQYDFSELKELMLHISFQTELNSGYQDIWKSKLFALSNQRYNPKKH